MKKGISLFIPVFNSAKIIENTIIKVNFVLKKLNQPYELIIVDDNSKDNTETIIDPILKKNKHIKYLKMLRGPSRRENLSLAFYKGKFNYAAYLDADLSTKLDGLSEMIRFLEEGYDIIIGSRYLSNSKVKRRFFRKIISFVYNRFLRFLFGSKLLDHQCGFKAFKREKLLILIDEAGYDYTFKRGWFLDAEILIRAQKHNFKIKELPVNWSEGKQSSFNFLKELLMFKRIIELKCEFITSPYSKQIKR